MQMLKRNYQEEKTIMTDKNMEEVFIRSQNSHRQTDKKHTNSQPE